MMAENEPAAAEPLDLLWGAGAIAAALNLSRRRCYWWLESGQIPARKVGTVWVASREALRQHFNAGGAA